jgi:GMP reductase
VDLNRKFSFVNAKLDIPYKGHKLISEYSGIPIMASNMDGVGTIEVADALISQGMFTCLTKIYTEKELIEYYLSENNKGGRSNYVAMSIGITDEDRKKFSDVYEQVGEKLRYVCIDVANGYTERFCNFISDFRNRYPNIVIIAGNVCTADQTQELILKGADIVKCGIGPGSVCTTRVKTGVGYPQLSTIIECSDAAHGLGGHIISDGGCTVAGDIAKAFGGGADFVMLGGMLAGHDEGGGKVSGNKVQFYGMSSKTANDKHFGGLRNYRAAEGKTVEVPYRGKITDTVQDILGGLRSACTYSGARRLKDLCKCTTFIRTTVQENKVYS